MQRGCWTSNEAKELGGLEGPQVDRVVMGSTGKESAIECQC